MAGLRQSSLDVHLNNFDQVIKFTFLTDFDIPRRGYIQTAQGKRSATLGNGYNPN